MTRLLLALSLILFGSAQATADPPRLERRGAATQLIVDGSPRLLLAGELSNSAASSADYMEPIWPRLKAMHLDTVLAPVSWELVEPVEGRFDFSSVDALLDGARRHDLKLVLLWFGAWKNSMSTYPPSWVKRDQRRFPRAQGADGESVEILSAHSSETLAADARAFAALLAHLRRVDSNHKTVLMVQVENEIGMLPTARDRSAAATRLFDGPVPAELTRYLAGNRQRLVSSLRQRWEGNGARTSGSWAQLFGTGPEAEEIFTAWHYARFVEALTRAGKAAYDLPMYVNAALNRPGRAPGEYPSGGPLPHLIDIWKAGAPSLDFLAPDIYFENFTEIVPHYDRTDNPLFIPEANRAGRGDSIANALFAIGAHDAIGFAPFSIDSVDDSSLGQGYAVLRSFEPTILAAQTAGRIRGVKAPVAFDGSVDVSPQRVELGGYAFTVSLVDVWTPRDRQQPQDHAAILIQTGPEEYLVAGRGAVLTFEPIGRGPGLAGIDSAWEGRFNEGHWVPGRLLNGDETHQGRHIRLPPGPVTVQRVKLYRYR